MYNLFYPFVSRAYVNLFRFYFLIFHPEISLLGQVTMGPSNYQIDFYFLLQCIVVSYFDINFFIIPIAQVISWKILISVSRQSDSSVWEIFVSYNSFQPPILLTKYVFLIDFDGIMFHLFRCWGKSQTNFFINSIQNVSSLQSGSQIFGSN